MRLNPFHTHQWECTSEIFNSPMWGAKMRGLDDVLSERVLWGFTVIRQACAGCGASRAVEVTGDVRENRAEVAR